MFKVWYLTCGMELGGEKGGTDMEQAQWVACCSRSRWAGISDATAVHPYTLVQLADHLWSIAERQVNVYKRKLIHSGLLQEDLESLVGSGLGPGFGAGQNNQEEGHQQEFLSLDRCLRCARESSYGDSERWSISEGPLIEGSSAK